MTTGHVFIATSLDGFVARANHKIDWLTKHQTEGEDHGYESFVATVDGVVMGRGSYRTVLSFGQWPYQKPVVVMSKTLTPDDVPPPLRHSVEITRLDPIELMQELKKRGWTHAYIDGGRVVQSFIRHGLIKELTLTTVPTLIGDGIRLFGQLDRDIDLELIEGKTFGSGLVQARYRIQHA